MNYKHTKKLTGWGRTSFAKTNVFRPEYLSDLVSFTHGNNSPLLAYGCGRSYGDEALNPNGATILTTRLNRLLAFHEKTCELVCEAGVTIADIQQVFLPRGFTLMTSPGTAWVTVGGAIANDVHGKNHDRIGGFGDHVNWFNLLLANGEIVRCSSTENEDIFFATIGGLGLTGIITSVSLQLQKQPPTVRVANKSEANISAFMNDLRSVRESATYSVGWLDMTSTGKHFGRGILSTGEPVPIDLNDHSTSFRIPCNCPNGLLNRWTIKCFNQFYHHTQKKKKTFLQSLNHFLYPLDTIKDWNRLYGKRGFFQFQCVIPDESADSGIKEILQTVYTSSEMPFLTVLKTLGNSGQGLLSFPLRGFTLALDFPNKSKTQELLKRLEDITLAHDGRIYLAKDACLSVDGFNKMYPNLSKFQTILNKVDPHKKWQSMLAKRLQIREYRD